MVKGERAFNRALTDLEPCKRVIKNNKLSEPLMDLWKDVSTNLTKLKHDALNEMATKEAQGPAGSSQALVLAGSSSAKVSAGAPPPPPPMGPPGGTVVAPAPKRIPVVTTKIKKTTTTKTTTTFLKTHVFVMETDTN